MEVSPDYEFEKLSRLSTRIAVSKAIDELIAKTQSSSSTDIPVEPYSEHKDKGIEKIHLYGSRVYLGNQKLIGRYSNYERDRRINLSFRVSLYEAFKVAKNAFAQCTTEHNSSNSPSMMMHQLASLTFGCALKCHVQWEETSGPYTPDLLITLPNCQIYVDITGKNVDQKIKEMPNNIFKMTLNKYEILDFDDPLISLIKPWSIANDQNDMSFIYDSILCQAGGQIDMLYEKRLLEFFVNKNNKLDLETHSNCALESLLLVFEENCKNEKKELDKESLNQMIRDEFKDLMKEISEEKGEEDNDYFIFPRLAQEALEYKREKDLKLENPSSFINDGFLDFGFIVDEELETKLYEPKYNMKITTKAYLSLMDYPNDKNTKRLHLQMYYNDLVKKLGYHTAAWRVMFEERVFQKIGLNIQNPFKSHHARLSGGFEPTRKIPLPFDIEKCLINDISDDLDPDHLMFLNERSMNSLRDQLMYIRDYQELRFRHRVSLAIAYNHKPEKCFMVKHWKYDNFYALVKIKGLIYEKDKGVVYVSYFHNGSLLRTEKWRLSDLENYSVAHHRLVLILAAFRSNVGRDPSTSETTLYARILSENSWGLSKFLKVYRYFSSGVCMNSTEVKDTLKKLIKTVDKPVKSKLSFRMILRKLMSKSCKNQLLPSRTPLFDLEFKDIGWESFLLNLCPSNTYGKFRHLQSTIKELADEISLFDSSYMRIKSIYDDFKSIIEEPEVSKLKERYIKHFRHVIEVSKLNDGRFTFSPASCVSLYNDMMKTKISYKSMQSSVPPISDLMTAKSSTDRKGKPMLAVESISQLARDYNTTSTSILCLKILNKTKVKKKIDLTMRVFDKDQVGGDREISILSSEFRILQVVAERFFEKWAKHTNIDKLHDKRKTFDLISSYEQSIKGAHSVCLTADQTRWGPNFNTIIFGICSLMLSGSTTESYLPALICFLSEFKVFEMPGWIPSLFNLSNHYYSIPGLLSRNHMGQGIFHQSSSLYHSYVISTLRELIRSNFKKDIYPFDINRITYEADSFVTSDDVAIITYFKGYTIIKEEEKDSVSYVKELTRRIFTNIYHYFILFGIKTSTYKNIVSDKVEFNSIHLGYKCLGSTDLKFCYSLIDPSTTGNFLNDVNNVYDVYVSARNSLCSHSTACLISNMLLIKLCRQWKINFSLIGFPNDIHLVSGIPKTYTVKWDGLNHFYLNTESNLRYKTRHIINRNVNTGNPILDQYAKASLMRISGTRERTSYRSILTHSKEDKITISSDYFAFSDAIGETYTNFLRETVKDPEHVSMIVNREYQTTFSSYPEEHQSRKGFFKFLKLRDPIRIEVNISDLVSSHYPPEKYLSLDPDRIQLHMLRKRRTLLIEEPLFDYKTTSFVEALSTCEEKIRELEMSSTSCTVLNITESEDEIKFIQHVFYPPENLKFMKRNVLFKSCVDTRDLRNNTRYFPSRTTNIIRIKFTETQKINTIIENFGSILPNVKLVDVEVPEVDFENIMGFDFEPMFKNEENYRNKNGEKVFLNISLDKSKIPADLTEEDLKSESSMYSNKPSKTPHEMMMELMDYSFSGEELLELIENKQDEEQDDDLMDCISTIDETMSLLNSKRITKELSTISIELHPSMGIFTNPSWAINIVIMDSLINEMKNRKALYFQTERNSIFNWKDVVCYTFDHAFKSKIETLISSSRQNIRQNNLDKTRMSIRDSLYRIVNGAAVSTDFFLFLLNSFSNVQFTNISKGKIVSKENFLNCLKKY
jgi:hypothetical protein